MPEQKPTADESAVERIASAIEGQLYRLNEERAVLLSAATRLVELDDEITVLNAELARLTGRRKPKPTAAGNNPNTPKE